MTVRQKVLSTSPENRETPLVDVQSWVTPNCWFFVRSHYETPEIDAARSSHDLVGDAKTLQQEMDEVANQRSGWPLDVTIELMSGAGI